MIITNDRDNGNVEKEYDYSCTVPSFYAQAMVTSSFA